MTDNNPEYFERLARMIVRIADGALGRASYDGIEADERRLIEASSALRAAAALARELTEAKMICGKSLALAESAEHRAESAESANRALQDELTATRESLHEWRRQFNKACEDANKAEAEVDRLRDCLSAVAETFPSSAKMVRNLLTGTDTPSEETP